MNVGEISVFLIYRRTYLADVQRRDIGLPYIQRHVPRRCTSARYKSLISYIQTRVLRRCISARYQSSLYTDGSTSPMLNGEISVFLIYRHMYLAVVHRQGTSLIYRRMYLVVVHRRDISLSYIQTHVPRRCTSARYQSFLYTDAPTSPLYIGEISVFLIYRRIYLAVVHRRGGGSISDNLLNNTYCEIGEFCLVLYIETVT